jgi:endoglucanase
VDAETGRTAFEGKPALRMSHDREEKISTSTLHNVTGEDVYELDFSALTTPGEYYVLVPGVGRSYPFRIAADVYAEPFLKCTRAILHQRCGIELREPYTTYTRGACHRGPAYEIDATLVSHGLEAEDELVAKDPAIKTGRQLDVWGGYHDAADYDRLARHYGIPPCLMIAYEMFPEAYTDGQLNIPESGNGIPDIVDEALWQVDFGMRMQDPQTGGVRGGAGPNAVVTAPADRDANPIYVYSTDPITSLQFAGVASQAARVLNGLGRTQAAAPYLERARKAWAYAVANGGERYLIPRAFAALELFRATGEAAYHEAFLKDAPAIVRLDPLAQADYGGVYVWDVWMSYAMAREDGVDEEVREACRRCVIAAADHETEVMDSYAYRIPNWIPAPIRYGWGNCGNFPGGEYSIMAWYLTGRKRYRDNALLAADSSLGCHPTGTVFITGLGRRHVKWALHPFSDPLASAVKAPVGEPLPGMLVANVHAYPTEFSGWQSQLLYVYANPAEGTDSFYPPSKEWPDLRLHADIGWAPIVCEAGLTMHAAFLYGGLLSAGRQPLAAAGAGG